MVTLADTTINFILLVGILKIVFVFIIRVCGGGFNVSNSVLSIIQVLGQ